MTISMRVYSGVIMGVAIFLYATSLVSAATPECMLSWKAQVSAPTWYEGKLLPVIESSVRVVFELVDITEGKNGKIINLANREIRWYLDGDLVRKGRGLQSLIIQNKLIDRDVINVKVSAQTIDDQTGADYFTDCFVSIPTTNRKLLLVSKNFGNTVIPGTHITWHAIPLFFATTPQAGQITWTVGGAKVSPSIDNPFTMTIQAGDAGQMTDVRISISGSKSVWENISTFARIYIR